MDDDAGIRIDDVDAGGGGAREILQRRYPQRVCEISPRNVIEFDGGAANTNFVRLVTESDKDEENGE